MKITVSGDYIYADGNIVAALTVRPHVPASVMDAFVAKITEARPPLDEFRDLLSQLREGMVAQRNTAAALVEVLDRELGK